MAMYRCAVCGSPHVRKEENNSGFSYKKALVGTVVFGAVGAVAGINGKTTVAYTCSDCGSIMPEPMDKYTLDLIETALLVPPQIRTDSMRELLDRYSYIAQENKERIRAADPYLNNSSPASYSVTTVSEEAFVAAAEKADYLNSVKRSSLYKQFVRGDRHFDPSIINDCKAQLAEAIRALPIVYGNLQYYTHCILPDRDPNTPLNLFEKKPWHLSKLHLKRAITYYILYNHGDMSPSELYDYVNDDSIAKKNFDILFGDRVRKSYSLEKELCPNLYVSKEAQDRLYKFMWISKANYDCLENVPLRWIEFIIRNGLLYARNPQSEEEFTEQVAQKREEAIPAALKQEMHNNRLKAAGVKIPTKLPVTAAEDDIQRDILRLGQEVAVHQEMIEKLSKKIFGKKKAMKEIDRLNTLIQECNSKINCLKEQAAALEKERNCRLDELQQKAREQQRELDNAYAALTAQKEEYVRLFDKENATNYDAWICLEK